MKIFRVILIPILLICSISINGQTQNNAPLSKNAPTDKPVNIIGAAQLDDYIKLIAPYVAKALKTLPKAKKKYLTGLKYGESFFLTTRIYDEEGHFEQIFVRVIQWDIDYIKGTIANDIGIVKGFKFGQVIEFPESAVLDWLITKPNGKEEGNFVGKFLDSFK